jgi:hypothetical protein
MKVEQAIVTAQPGPGRWTISSRVLLQCELIGPPDDPFYAVRLLEAGAGLEVGTEITVPAAKVTLD